MSRRHYDRPAVVYTLEVDWATGRVLAQRGLMLWGPIALRWWAILVELLEEAKR